MTLLDVLRVLSASGVGLVRAGARLRVEGPTRALTAVVKAAVTEHKAALLAAVEPAAVRAAFDLPDAPVGAALAVVLARLAMERDALGDGERALYEERAALREHEGRTPRWLAEPLALEDVLIARASVPLARGAAA